MTRQPNHTEQQSAEELDQLITAIQQGKLIPVEHKDGQLAQQLMQVTASIQPKPSFNNSLRTQLIAQANQKSQLKKGATRPSFIEGWVNKSNMKRLIFAGAGLTAVIALGFLGWNILLRPTSVVVEPGTEIAAAEVVAVETAVDEVINEVVEEPVESETENSDSTIAAQAEDVEQPIPSETIKTEAANEAVVTDSQPFRGLGGGGGGGYGFNEGEGPFTNATITLNAELPLESEAAVYANTAINLTSIDQEQVRAFAEKMGISGDIYFEWYSGLPIDGQDDGSGNVPYVYRIFDGKRQVSAYLSGEMFYEDTNLYNQTLAPLPFAERATIATQFLQERGLLDFEYELHSGWGNEVQFLPLQDGRPVNNWSLITVNVAGDSQILSVSIRPLGSLDQVRVDALRSASDAWQYLQDNFVDGRIMFNLIASDPAYYAPPTTGSQKTHWDREFTVGQEVVLNSWIQMFRAANGSGALRLVTDRGIVLAADNAMLEAIAETASSGNNIRLQGTLSGETDNLVLNVSNWEPITGPSDNYLNGTTKLINGAMSLELPGGFPIQIANPPADLPADTPVSVVSSSIRVADDGVSAIMDWVAFDLLYYNYVDTGVAVEDPFTNISSVTINDVELVYQYLYPYESFNFYTGVPYMANDNSHLAPVWRFTGETNKGDLVEFMIPGPASVELPTAPAE